MEKIKHQMDEVFYFCKCCGKSMEYLMEFSNENCQGNQGTIHIDYIKAKNNFNKNIGYIANKIING